MDYNFSNSICNFNNCTWNNIYGIDVLKEQEKMLFFSYILCFYKGKLYIYLEVKIGK